MLTDEIRQIQRDATPVPRSEFRLAIQNVTRLVRLAQDNFKAYAASQFSQLKEQTDGAIARIDARLAEVKDGVDGQDADEQVVIQKVLSQIRQPKDGETPVLDYPRIIREVAALIPPPKDGTNADPQTLIPQLLAEIDKRVPLLEDSLRAGLTTLLEEFVVKTVNRLGPGGGTSFSLQQSGTQKVQQPIALNFTGTGAPTITHRQSGVTDISFGSSGGFTTLDATETPNGSTTAFTFASATAKPSYLVVDNVWMKATSKAGTVNWTWNSGTTVATLTLPAQDDIFAVV
jgi:hypothetical protein